MAYEQISPELALVDPALASRDQEGALSMIEALDPTTNGHAPAVNGTVDPAADSGRSLEALLFDSGAISADQLGELVRDSVLTGRPVAALALERGLTTAEALAALQAGAEEAPAPAPVVEQPAAVLPLVPVEPVQAVPVIDVVAAPVAPAPDPAPAPAVPELQMVVPLPRLAPSVQLDERVQAAVESAAGAPPPAPPAPIPAPTVEPVEQVQQEIVAAVPEVVAPGAPAGFSILVRLQTGERVPVDTAATLEQAAEIARALAGRFANHGEWPMLAGRFVRPEAVVSIDIERAIGS